MQTGATGADAAALRIAAEGNEGASVTVGSVAAADAGGCFPGIWTTNAFNDYLHGNLTGGLLSMIVSGSGPLMPTRAQNFTVLHFKSALGFTELLPRLVTQEVAFDL